MLKDRQRSVENDINDMVNGDRWALARLITAVENEPVKSKAIWRRLCPKPTHTIGITGPPGAGKSTLVSKFIRLARESGKRVGVVCIDPSSPFSGGAILGDRVRMHDHFLDEGVFIRSMATRKSKGGLARASKNVIRLMESFGFDLLIVETVGVGQVEIDVVEATDTVVVVLVPESGDTMQLVKSGLLEIASIYVINKADHIGSDKLASELEAVSNFKRYRDGEWKPPIVMTVASNGKGVDELVQHTRSHYAHLLKGNEFDVARKRQYRSQCITEAKELFQSELEQLIRDDEDFRSVLSEVEGLVINPMVGAERILELLKKGGKSNVHIPVHEKTHSGSSTLGGR